jgi:hypothetical protein
MIKKKGRNKKKERERKKKRKMNAARGFFSGPRPDMLFDIPDMDDDESKDIVKEIVKLESESRKFDKNPEKQMEKQNEEMKQLEKLKLRVMVQQDTEKKKAALKKIQQKLKQTRKERVKTAYKRIRPLLKQKKDVEARKIADEVINDLPEVDSDDSSNEEYDRAKEVVELVADQGKKRDVEDAGVFFENLSSVKKPKVVVLKEEEKPTENKAITTTDPFVLEFHRELTDIVQRATIPLINFAGMVAKIVRVDYVSRLLAPKEERSHLVELGVDVEDFFDKNRDLGVNLLNLFMTGIEDGLQKQQFVPAQMGGDIHPCFDLDDLEDVTTRAVDQTLLGEIETLKKTIKRLMDNNQPAEDQIKQLQIATTKQSIQNARIKLIGGDLEHRFAPAWAFEVMGSAVFRKVLAGTTLGAFETAYAEVRRIPNCRNFTMKELICSPEVYDKFAYLVAFSWLSSGDDTSQQVGGAGGKKDRAYQNNQYLNILKMRDQLRDEITMCKIFFEVSVRRGKSKVKRAFEEAFERRKPQKLNDLSAADYVKWEDRMNLYLSQMPEYELFYHE